MRNTVAHVRFTRASAELERTGLMGWVRCHLNGIEVDGIAIRRTAEGRIVPFLPERQDKSGKLHRVVWIPDADERDSVSRSILAVLRARREIA